MAVAVAYAIYSRTHTIVLLVLSTAYMHNRTPTRQPTPYTHTHSHTSIQKPTYWTLDTTIRIHKDTYIMTWRKYNTRHIRVVQVDTSLFTLYLRFTRNTHSRRTALVGGQWVTFGRFWLYWPPTHMTLLSKKLFHLRKTHTTCYSSYFFHH